MKYINLKIIPFLPFLVLGNIGKFSWRMTSKYYENRIVSLDQRKGILHQQNPITIVEYIIIRNMYITINKQ